MKVNISNVEILKEFYTIFDHYNLEESIEYYTRDATLNFSNVVPAVGREAIQELLSGLKSSVNGIKHELKNAWEDDDTVIIECDISFTRRDNREVVIPASQFCIMENGMIKQQRIYLDITPVYS